MGFQEFLKTKGFIEYRKIFINKEWKLIPSTNNDISSTISGGLDIRYIKDNIEIVWGLGEMYIPPTLLSPKLNITCLKCEPLTSHLVMVIRCFQKYSNEEILEALINNTSLTL